MEPCVILFISKHPEKISWINPCSYLALELALELELALALNLRVTFLLKNPQKKAG
ncbi:MAG: hypothetical protein R6W90_16425 [Ignavibacteriaceae bacterium]